MLRTGDDPEDTISYRGLPFFIELQGCPKCHVEQIGILTGIIAVKFCLPFHKTCRASTKGKNVCNFTKCRKKTEENAGKNRRRKKKLQQIGVFSHVLCQWKDALVSEREESLWSWCNTSAQLGIPPGSCESTISFDIRCFFFIHLF